MPHPAPPGPLFVGPAASAFPWLEILPLLLAAPAAVLLLWALARGRLPPAHAGLAIVLPIAAYGLGALFLLEESKDVKFCGSCHVMEPIRASLQLDDGLLASTHYRHGRVPHAQACYTCHSGYGIWGTFDAKAAGVRHMINTVLGDYQLPIKLNGPFDISSCLNCHAYTPGFRAVETHQEPEIQKQLLDHELSCVGVCHPAAHPESALNGKMPPS